MFNIKGKFLNVFKVFVFIEFLNDEVSVIVVLMGDLEML